MDRRAFLKTGSGAAAAAAGVGFAEVGAVSAPGLVLSRRELRMAIPWAVETPVLGDAALRLARRLETACDDRYRLQPVTIAESGIEAIRSGAADVYYGTEHQNVHLEPALAYFAGIPRIAGLNALEHQAWLAAAGGQLLWDDLAGDLGVKPLLAGSILYEGFWLREPLTRVSGLKGMRLHVLGLAKDVLSGLGGIPVSLPVAELPAALDDARIAGAQGCGPLADMALGLHASAKLYARCAAAGWTAVSLGLRRALWNSLPSADQAIFEACAAEEARTGMAEAMTHRRIIYAALARQHDVAIRFIPVEIESAFAGEWSRVVGELASGSARAARIAASYTAFRELSGDPMV